MDINNISEEEYEEAIQRELMQNDNFYDLMKEEGYKHVGTITDPSVELFHKLSSILDDMGIPSIRRTDWGWLLRNLPIRNREHKDINEAIKIIKELSFYKPRRNRDV